MNIVILNRFPLEKITYSEWIDEEIELFVFTNKQPQTELNKYNNVVSYDDYDDNEKVILDIIELSKNIPIDLVVSLSEKDILRAGFLRSHLNIPGLDEEVSWDFRDKVSMKNTLRSNNIPVTNYAAITNVISILEFASLNGPEIVIKPRRGAGSRGVTVVKSKEELIDTAGRLEYVSPNDGQEWMIEKFVEGDLYHVDGIYSEGQCVSSFVSKYITSCLGFTENNPLISVLLDPKEDVISKEIMMLNDKALKALGRNHTFIFHAEIFVSKDGGLYVNEIACRVGGAKIYPTLKKVLGYDLIEEYFKIITKQEHVKLDFHTTKSTGWVLVPPQKGTVKKLPELLKEPWIIEQNIHGQIGKETSNPLTSVDKIYDAIVVGDSTSHTIDRLEELTNKFIENLEYN